MPQTKVGERVETGPRIAEMDFSGRNLHVSTERYHSNDYAAREREILWFHVWHAIGRADDIPKSGDWFEYRLFDQSWVIVRGRDDKIRGFVNACRHRGNAFCNGRGHDARFLCEYHNWSYSLDGKVLAIPKPDYDGPLQEFAGCKENLGLLEVSVEVFAGFIFFNADPDAPPLDEFLGEAKDLLAPYRVEEMIPYGFNVREAINCNYKVVMDAFQEGYHIQGVHPQLVAAMDESEERYHFLGDHSVATAPFGAVNREHAGHIEEEIKGIRSLPETFPAVADALPRFEALLDQQRGADGALPADTSPRLALQQALRETWQEKGLDISGLTDNQLSDNHFWLLFPNFFLTIHAGEGTLIMVYPHESGDPNRCVWHVQNLQWFPPVERAEHRTPLTDVSEDDHYDYFLALEQDYRQMSRQQIGLRQTAHAFLTLTRQEVRLAHYHEALNRWMQK